MVLSSYESSFRGFWETWSVAPTTSTMTTLILHASFRTFQRSSAFLCGFCGLFHFPRTSAAFCKLQQLSANISVCNVVLLPMYWSATLQRGWTRKVSSPPNPSAIPAVFRILSRLLWSFPLSAFFRGFCGLFHFPQTFRGSRNLLAVFRVLIISYGTPAAFRTSTSSSSFLKAFRVCTA
jgi:hypothetical protein